MRGLIVFLAILVIVFFVVGDTHGWYVGVPSHTPVFVYKMTTTGQASRHAVNVDALPVRLSGTVRHGSVEVKVIFHRPRSFQTSTAAGPDDTLYDHTYQAGEHIAIDQKFKGGQGDYTVVLQFNDATGFFRLTLPPETSL